MKTRRRLVSAAALTSIVVLGALAPIATVGVHAALRGGAQRGHELEPDRGGHARRVPLRRAGQRPLSRSTWG